MQTIKFDDFMKNNYKVNRYKDISETIIEIAIEIAIAIGISIFGLIFFEQFIEVMQSHLGGIGGL